MYSPDDPIRVAPGIRREPILVKAHTRPADWSPNSVLQLADGRRTTIMNLVGDRELVIQFFYTRCNGSCPTTTRNLMQVTKSMPGRFGRSAVMLSISLDPERDTIDDLRRYKANNRLPGWWNLARIDRKDLDRLLDSVGFRKEKLDPKTQRIVHASEVIYGSRRNKRWCVTNAGVLSPAVVRENFLISWDSVRYKNPRRPGIDLIPGQYTKV